MSYAPPPYYDRVGHYSNDGAEVLDEALEREDDVLLGLAIAQYRRVLEGLLAAQEEEVRGAAVLCEAELFGQRFDTDVLRKRQTRATELVGEPDREPLGLVADVDEAEAHAALYRRLHDSLGSDGEHGAGRRKGSGGGEVAGGGGVGRAPRGGRPPPPGLGAGNPPAAP